MVVDAGMLLRRELLIATMESFATVYPEAVSLASLIATVRVGRDLVDGDNQDHHPLFRCA